ncbi:MAG: hypothetical protein EXR65_01215 [Dehalococcoidia bacterium]|nr:hypothetical protein [Dehalococcoidia bacterium]
METAAPVKFQLPDPAYERAIWMHQEHMPCSLTPLAQDAGMMQAFVRPAEAVLPRMIHVNGYVYTRSQPGVQSFGAFPAPNAEQELRRWREDWLDPVEQAAATLEGFDATAVPAGGWRAEIDRQQAMLGEVFRGVHMATMRPALGAAEAFISGYVALMGESRRHDAMALLHGFRNASGDRAAALWELGRLVRAHPPLRRALERDCRDPGRTAAAEQFRRGLEAVLERFGCTTQGHAEDLPPWREDPAVPVGAILLYAEQDDDRDPRGQERRQRERREPLERELRALAAGDRRAAALLDTLRAAQYMVPVSEDHNLLADQRLLAASRTRWLLVGEHLRARRLVERADDVFYHHLDELIAALEEGTGLAAQTIDERRERQLAWRSVAPPQRLGLPPEQLDQEAATAPAPTEASAPVRGTPASPGVHRGRARVIAHFEQASTLERGDVLICAAATPEWTPYFVVIGALVTDSGSVLTHGAVVAREFGLPAVVAARNATRVIPDGAMVTVDGLAGTVTVEA